MRRISTKKIVLNGLMIALVFLATYFSRIPSPVPPGYVNIGDAVIMVAAVLLGRKSGFISGAVGSCLADLAASAFIYAPVTFIVKGIEGLVIGTIAASSTQKPKGEMARLAGVIIGAVIMVAGYFVAEAFILGAFDKDLGLSAAIIDLVPNMVQGGVCAVVGYLLSTMLARTNVQKYILE